MNCSLNTEKMAAIFDKLNILYGAEDAQRCIEQIAALLERYPSSAVRAGKSFPDEQDVMLITYGDQIQDEGKNPPLLCLLKFLEKHWSGLINTVHLLPIFPYSSDDGFSVIDYRKVDDALGSWQDIAKLRDSFFLMFDAVINHVSAQSQWFRSYLDGDLKYQSFFIEASEDEDLSSVTRPRTLPLLTPFQVGAQKKFLWTTFSEDQIDLNYANPKVLLEIIDILLFYVRNGADLLRLDAIGYLWKKKGTSCINLEETHLVVQLLRDTLDLASPECRLVTETNVPHPQNISYLADGSSEAQMVYQFALPPLVMHAFFRGDSSYLSDWAKKLRFPKGRSTYLNFLASHDGIGVTPANGLLPQPEIDALCQLAKDRGGFVSYKNNADGSQTPYELNITYFNAIAAPDKSRNEQVQMFLSAQAIMLAMRGMPGIYIHSLLGTPNDLEGVKRTGRYRSINRKKFEMQDLEQNVLSPDSVQHQIIDGMKLLIGTRTQHSAFHPDAEQTVLDAGSSIFALLRSAADKSEQVLCLSNLCGQKQTLELPASAGLSDKMQDLLTGTDMNLSAGKLLLEMEPYQTLWLAGI